MRVPLEIDVSDVLGSGAQVRLRGWLRVPATPSPHAVPVVYCLAGGRCSTAFFDLHPDGHAGYSMADHLAARGAAVVAFDHLGIGSSDPLDDVFTVTPTLLARCHDVAVRAVIDGLRRGDLVAGVAPVAQPFAVGLGHSMGGMLAGVQQARHRSFDALVLLGHGGSGLPEVLTREELAVRGPDLATIEDEIARLARVRFAPGSPVVSKRPPVGCFFTDDVPAEVREAFARTAVPLLPTCGLASMIPHSARAEQEAVTVPTFIGFGEHDLVGDHAATVAQYPGVTDAALYVLQGSGHCHNQAAGRQVLWDRIIAWLAAVSGQRAG